jgi:uncharacterized repeat protein (TIGR02543 family)
MVTLNIGNPVVPPTPVSTFTVTYSANGGTGKLSDPGAPYASGSNVTVLSPGTSITRYSHTFTGWNTQADGSGTSYFAGDIFTITGNVTLYAQWEPVRNYYYSQHTVTIPPASNGRVVSNVYYAEINATVTLTIIPAPGYVLDSIIVYRSTMPTTIIRPEGDDNTRTFVMPTYDVTVIATFKVDNRTGVEDVTSTTLTAFSQNSVLYVSGLTVGTTWSVYNITGIAVYRNMADNNTAEISLKQGIYIVTDGKKAVKVLVK